MATQLPQLPQDAGVRSACRGGRVSYLCGALILAIAGCRSVDNAQVDLLERELRQQEDYIYELEDYLIEYSEKLRQYRMACQAPSVAAPAAPNKRQPRDEPELVIDPPRTSPGRSSRGAGPTAAPAEAQPDVGDAAEPLPQQPAPDAVDPESMEVPGLEIGEPHSGLNWQQADQIAAVPAPSGGDDVSAIPDPAEYLVDAEDASMSESAVVTESTGPTAPDAAEPTLPPVVEELRLPAVRLDIRRMFAQPADEDGGSASLLVVVECLNAKDEPVEADGKASIMVMGSDETGVLKRIDRWDFTAEETAAAWQTSRLGDGLHLQLPLGETALPEAPLELWARLVSADGAKLLTRLPFETAKLVAIEDAAGETETAEAPAEETIPAATENGVAVAESAAGGAQAPNGGAAELPAPRWRASAKAAATGPRAEGFGSTLGPPGTGWAAGQGGTIGPGNSGNTGVAGNGQPAQWRRGDAVRR